MSSKPPPDPKQGLRVKAAIAYGPYTQIQIADALGFTEDQLRRYLRGEVAFTHSQLVLIAEMCDVALRLLYEDFPPYDPAGELGRAAQDSPPNEPRPDR